MEPTADHPAYGVRLDPTLPTEHGLAELIGWGAVLGRTAVFSGLTAARFHRLWLPELPEDLPYFVAQAKTARRSTRSQFHVTRHPTPPTHVTVRGIRIANVPETLMATASLLGLLDQVVLIDSALHESLCTRAELTSIGQQRRRGAPAFRAALALADRRSESAWESMLRLLHLTCGVPVTPQVELRDTAGRFIARVDLEVDATGQIQEYDGAGHRTADVLRRDLARDRRMADIGRQRRAWTAADLLYRPAEVLAPIADALGTSIDVSPWLELLDDCTATDSGRLAFEQRLGRPLKWRRNVAEEQSPATFGAT